MDRLPAIFSFGIRECTIEHFEIHHQTRHKLTPWSSKRQANCLNETWMKKNFRIEPIPSLSIRTSPSPATATANSIKIQMQISCPTSSFEWIPAIHATCHGQHLRFVLWSLRIYFSYRMFTIFFSINACSEWYRWRKRFMKSQQYSSSREKKKICSPSPFPIRDLFPMRKTWLRLSRPAIHLTLIRHINLYVMEGRPGEHASQRNRKWGGKDGICKTVSKPDTYGLMDYTDITHIDRYTFPFLDIFFHIFWLLVYAVWRCKFRSVFFSICGYQILIQFGTRSTQYNIDRTDIILLWLLWSGHFWKGTGDPVNGLWTYTLSASQHNATAGALIRNMILS